MFVRVTRLSGGSPAKIDENARYVEEEVLPLARGLDGYTGCLAFADRGSGTQYALTFWESEATLWASEREFDRLTDIVTNESIATATVEHCELTVSDVKQLLPELLFQKTVKTISSARKRSRPTPQPV